MTPPAGAPREADVRAAMEGLRALEPWINQADPNPAGLTSEQYVADLALVARALAEREEMRKKLDWIAGKRPCSYCTATLGHPHEDGCWLMGSPPEAPDGR